MENIHYIKSHIYSRCVRCVSYNLKEIRESQYWIELLIESKLIDQKRFQPLLDEANEIGKILTTMTKKLKEK